MPADYTHTQITVGTSSLEILVPNSGRNYVLLQNNGTTTIYLRLDGGTATTSSGVRLNANGGSLEISGAIGNLYHGSITAISSATGGLLLVTHRTH